MSDTSLSRNIISAREKRELLKKSLLQKARARTSVKPMSHGQKALWFLQQSAPGSAAYHVAFTARIRSRVDVAALRRAFQLLLNRHPALRAGFQLHNAEPIQIHAEYQELCFQQTDASSWTREELNKQVTEAYRRPFDLEQGPLLRVDLFTGAEQDHVLLLTIHHIAFDAWSLWIFLDELRLTYSAERAGISALLPPLVFSHADYVRWQNEMLEGPRGQILWAYWQKQLSGATTELDLPADRPRPAVQTYRGASLAFNLSADLSQRLKRLAQTEGATPFMLLLAAFQVFLHRLTGQEDILVGSPVAGRSQPELAGVVGYFVNPVVLRAQLSGNPTFKLFLRQVIQTVFDAMAHEEYPFPLLVKRLQPKRDASYSPLFQASFVLQKAQRAGGITDTWVPGDTQTRMRWGDLEVELFDMAQQEGQFDLELEMMEAAGAFHGAFKYNADLFDPDRVARMTEIFAVLLEGIAENPDHRVALLPLLTDGERQRLLASCRGMPSRQVDAECLHWQFERQVRKNPDAVAVIYGDTRLTYRELNARANCLATHLQSLGVGPEILVGICVERSLDMIVGLLGILKAGGAYLPLDPASPKERLAFIVADSAVPVLLTQAALVQDLPATTARVLCLDADWPLIAESSARNPFSHVDADNLAYVIYTSGSTGKPKGVQITHANVARLFTSTETWYRFNDRDVWTLFHSFAFDFSVWELWGALLYGGRLVVVPYWISRAPDDFLELLARQAVTVLNQTPSAFRQLMQAEERANPPPPLSLRLVIFGGEQLDPQSLKPWFERHGDASPQLVNMYGITETTVHVTYRPLTLADLASTSSLIGRPIADLQIYILDRHQQPVPLGVAGEIHVGGAGLARGYLNRPELSAEKFIPHPFTQEADARLYRSGDLARYLPNGDMEYLGRIDNQVKIRGFRIELGEIETALSQHADVSAAVVTMQKDPKNENRLVAYVVGAPSRAPTTAELRRFLLEKLPSYMVPAAFVALDRLPLTNNGKIDYRALPAPTAGRGDVERRLMAPRDALEQGLVRLWETVLDSPAVGIRDNFFDLGGDSLLAVVLMVEIEREFGKRLPIATLFQNPTVEQLGELLRDQTAAPSWSPLVPIQPRGSAPPFFCVPGGGGNVLYFQPLAQHLGEHQPVYGLQAAGLDGESAPYARVEDMARCYIDAIQAVQAQGPYLLGGHCFGGVVALEMAQQLQRQGQEVALLAILDAPAPIAADVDIPVAHDIDEVVWLTKIANSIEQASGKSLGIRPETLAPLSSEARLNHLKEGLQSVGFLPPGSGVEHVRGLVEVSKANVRAQLRYVPHDIHPIRITLFRARELHPDYDYGAGSSDSLEMASLGWDRYAAGPVTVEVVPGNHITMLAEAHAGVLAERLGARLRAAAGKKTASTILFHKEVTTPA